MKNANLALGSLNFFHQKIYVLLLQIVLWCFLLVTTNQGVLFIFLCFHLYFLARPQLISSGLDTITIKFQPVRVTDISYTVQIWSKTTATWRDTRCIQSTVKNTCVVTNLSRIVTLTGLSPGHAYFVRLASSSQGFSQVSEPMETKKLGKSLTLTFSF